MSTGLVICSICKREVHQWGEITVGRGWVHCPDRTPICEGAHAIYPRTQGEILGAPCCADGPVLGGEP